MFVWGLADDTVDERALLMNSREIGCTQAIPKETMFALAAELGDEDFPQRYTRFEAMVGNPLLRECPTCAHRQLAKGYRSPRMVCEQCATEFCFTHGAAHPGLTCREYAPATTASASASAAAAAAAAAAAEL